MSVSVWNLRADEIKIVNNESNCITKIWLVTRDVPDGDFAWYRISCWLNQNRIPDILQFLEPDPDIRQMIPDIWPDTASLLDGAKLYNYFI